MALSRGRLPCMVAILGFGCAVAQTTVTNSLVSIPTSITFAPTHGPFPTANVLPLPLEFSDIPQEAVSCWDSHANYSVTSSFLESEIFRAQVWSASTFPTPRTSAYSTSWDIPECGPMSYPGLTTLCDGYPRASDCIPQCPSTRTTVTTRYITSYSSVTWLLPPWATELEELREPTCTVAPDLSEQCKRLGEAYEWRVSAKQPPINGTATPSSTNTLAVPPACSVFVTPTTAPTPTIPKCSFVVGGYEAHYWPTSFPPPSFCKPDASNPNPSVPSPTTNPNHPPTRTISGIVMTSPYVYHIIKNVTILTYAGRASGVGNLGSGKPVYTPSTIIPALTLSQNPSSLLSQSQECHKPSPRGATRCTISLNPDFRIADLYTVQAEEYYGKPLETKTTATICQASYRPTIALALTDVAAQNGVGEECEWTWEHSLRTKVYGPAAVSFENVKTDLFHTITTTTTGGPTA